jgi:phosphate/sulfate permease
MASAVLLAFAFAVTNGLHDASNVIATLVATRAARPRHALASAAARCARPAAGMTSRRPRSGRRG